MDDPSDYILPTEPEKDKPPIRTWLWRYWNLKRKQKQQQVQRRERREEHERISEDPDSI